VGPAAKAPLGVAKAIWEHAAFLRGKEEEEQVLCNLIRDVIGNPFRALPPLPPATLAWNDGTVVKLATAIYENRRFEDMPVLADALEEAGCDQPDLLSHLRGPGQHVRGCWVVDLLLGKS
jgi:hypothetical protein